MPKWLISTPNGFQVIINDDFLGEGVLWPKTPTLCKAYRFYIKSLTTVSGSRLFVSV